MPRKPHKPVPIHCCEMCGTDTRSRSRICRKCLNEPPDEDLNGIDSRTQARLDDLDDPELGDFYHGQHRGDT